MSENKKELDILEIAAKASQLIEKNFKIVLGAVVGMIVVGIVWAQMNSMERSKQQQAFQELFAITKVYNQKKADFAEAKAEKEEAKKPKKDQKAKKKKKPKKNLVEASGDINKDYPEVVQKLEAFLLSHSGTNASGEAALTLSEIYDEYKMPQKGADALDKTLKAWGGKNIIFYVMQMRAGDLWASSNQCEKATSYWQTVGNSDSFVAPQAQLKMGVCMLELGRLDEAKIWFQKITAEDAKESAEKFNAKRYLKFLEFESKTQKQSQTKKANQDKAS